MDINKAATEPEIGPEIETTKQLAALRQITAAIEHLRKREFECAITLAAAAEGLLPLTDEPHMFSELKEDIPPEEFKYLDFNMIVNWLKHYKPQDPDPFSFLESEAANLILRAITKFIAVYYQSTKRMEAFLQWYSAHYNFPVDLSVNSATKGSETYGLLLVDRI
jgi:hypothetical protein